MDVSIENFILFIIFTVSLKYFGVSLNHFDVLIVSPFCFYNS